MATDRYHAETQSELHENTRKMTEHNGSWHNPEVAQKNRNYLYSARSQNKEVEPFQPQPSRRYPAERRRPAFPVLRGFLATVLALVALVCGFSGATAYWAQQNIIDHEGFAAISQEMASDSQFQHELANAVTDDVMNSSAITQNLGDGNSSGLFGGVQNWAHEQVKNTVSGASTSVIESDQYSEIWNQVMSDTHDYNLQSNTESAGLDITEIYQAVDSQVGTVLGYDPDLVGESNHIISLDSASANNPVHGTIKSVETYAQSWGIQLVISGVIFLLAFLLWPRGKFYFAAVWLLIAAACAWLGSHMTGLLEGGISSLNISSEVGKVFISGLAQHFSVSLSDQAQAMILPLLIVAFVLFLVGIALQLSRLTARGTTARSRNVN